MSAKCKQIGLFICITTSDFNVSRKNSKIPLIVFLILSIIQIIKLIYCNIIINLNLLMYIPHSGGKYEEHFVLINHYYLNVTDCINNAMCNLSYSSFEQILICTSYTETDGCLCMVTLNQRNKAKFLLLHNLENELFDFLMLVSC